jgi:arylsulfatase A-like enzyme/pimeloyl-ACP methyl ester carboxylesterase
MRLSLLLPAAASALLLINSGAQAQNNRPNIVIIVADDMGYGDIGVHGSKDIPTPNIDALAKGSTRFTDAYVTGPYCSPTRAGLLTGKYPQRFGHEFNPPGPNQMEIGLPVGEVTMADRFKAIGYRTALFGKWHLGFGDQFHPMERGFDEFYGFLGGAHTYFAAPDTGRISIFDGKKQITEPAYLTDAIADRAVSFIQRQNTQPFLLYLAFNAVHTPMHATNKYYQRVTHIKDNGRRTYAAMLVAMDDAIGKTMGALRDAGLEEHSLIFFFSDNGGPTIEGSSINASSNAPLRGSKRQTWEGGIRVPFFIRWKGHLPEDKVDGRPIIQLDILPTALAAAGVEVEAEWKLDGVNLLPYVNGTNTARPHDALYWRLGEHMAIRKGDWKLLRSVDGPLRDVDHTKPRDLSDAGLYNLKTDIGEKNDVARAHPDRVKDLAEDWLRWNSQLVQPLWRPGSGPPPEILATLSDHTIPVNNTALRYITQGSGPPVLLLHGSMQDGRIWERQRRTVVERHRFIALTMRYFGTAPWDDSGEQFSQATHIADAAAFVRELGIGPVIVVGWSYGAITALGLATQHPDLVQGVFVFEPPLASAVSDAAHLAILRSEGEKYAAAFASAMKASGDAEMVRQFAGFISDSPTAFDSIPRQVLGIVFENARTLRLGAGREQVLPGCKELSQIKVPVAVSRGESSRPLFRITAEAVSRCIPAAKLVDIPGATHFAPFQSANAFNNVLRSFLSGFTN